LHALRGINDSCCWQRTRVKSFAASKRIRLPSKAPSDWSPLWSLV
jgi:hypothetical protein